MQKTTQVGYVNFTDFLWCMQIETFKLNNYSTIIVKTLYVLTPMI